MKRLLQATTALILLASAPVLAQAGGMAQPGGSLPGVFGAPSPPPPPPGPQAPRREMPVARGPSIDLAYEAARAAVKSCVGKHIVVAILDQTGQPKLYYVPDGSSASHTFMAFRKANTALLIKAPSNQITTLAATNKDLADKVTGNPNYIVFGGGLPILVDGEVIGAIGVSGGGPEGIDTGCATDGLKAVQGRLR